jgi:hypothetical protein
MRDKVREVEIFLDQKFLTCYLKQNRRYSCSKERSKMIFYCLRPDQVKTDEAENMNEIYVQPCKYHEEEFLLNCARWELVNEQS